jgi:drug/metabolite transporter superfamily protein YnfA
MLKLQFAIAAFLVLLGAVELWEWFRARELPFPVLVLGGVVLAVVSNYQKLPIESMLAKVSGALTRDSDAE